MRIFKLSMAAALLFATPAVASGTLYDCTVKQQMGPQGWVSPRLALIIDEKGAGQIIDSLTLYFKTGPKPAKIRKQGENLVVRWSFAALQDGSSQNIPRFTFRATLNQKSGAFKIRGNPVGFPENVTGVGSCAQREKLSTKQLNRLLKG